MTKEEFVAKLASQGIDGDIAASMYDRSVKKDSEKKGRRVPSEAFSHAKKHIGRLEITEICQTCGGKFTHNIVTQIDPNKPQNTEVAVGVCSGCIPFYRTMSQDQLISLLILKDHPDIGFRMLSNRQQIKIALKREPVDLINARSELEPAQDARYLKPQH